MKFDVVVMFNGQKRTVPVEQIELTDQVQKLRIGTTEKCVVIQNNQPAFTRENKGLDLDWKIVSGMELIKDAKAFTTVLALINQKMRTVGKTTVSNGRVTNF